MNEYDAMLRAICAEPDEDTPRLALADWLDEHGEHERAEFIRTQIAIAPLQREADLLNMADISPRDPDWSRVHNPLTALRTRERGLWEWSGHGRDFLSAQWHDMNVFVEEEVAWSRGFVSTISLPCAAFMQHAQAIFESQPVCSVTISDRKPHDNGTRHVPVARRFMWCRDFADARMFDGWGLPGELHDRLTGYTQEQDLGGPHRKTKFYRAEADAVAALSAVCVAYARSLAGLPPLRRAEPVTARGGAGVLVNEREG